MRKKGNILLALVAVALFSGSVFGQIGQWENGTGEDAVTPGDAEIGGRLDVGTSLHVQPLGPVAPQIETDPGRQLEVVKDGRNVDNDGFTWVVDQFITHDNVTAIAGGIEMDNEGNAHFKNTAEEKDRYRYFTITETEYVANAPVATRQFASLAVWDPDLNDWAVELNAAGEPIELPDPLVLDPVTAIQIIDDIGNSPNIDPDEQLSEAGDGGNVTVDGKLTVAGRDVMEEISDNTQAIADEVAARTALIHYGGVNAYSNQIVRIGENSLVTSQMGDVAGVGGEQWLHGEDINGGHIDLRLGGDASVIVNNDLQVDRNLNVDGHTTLNTLEVIDEMNVMGGMIEVATDPVWGDYVALNRGAMEIYTDPFTGDNWADVYGNMWVQQDIYVGNNQRGLQAQVDDNRAMISRNARNIERNKRGIAMVAAMTHTTVLPGMDNALDVSMSHFEGKSGMAISYSRRMDENIQLNFAAATTTDFEEFVVRGGIGFQW